MGVGRGERASQAAVLAERLIGRSEPGFKKEGG
jgi:hypothetical protein